DVIRFTDALVGNELHQFTVSLRRSPGFHVDGRADGARANRVDADAVRRDLLSDALHHQHDATLARRVIDMAGPRNDFVHGAHANDLAGGTGNLLANAAPFEFPNRLAGAEKLSG